MATRADATRRELDVVTGARHMRRRVIRLQDAQGREGRACGAGWAEGGEGDAGIGAACAIVRVDVVLLSGG